ncbi:Zinc finger HIT domain-containing protein 2-like [Oopsacas minuta]|uniref:Zinc finger HIT domain-containing protein 2-like n=1 Tax=Oopsacas minuta TaxID=111878 RepID=A0AAV7JYT5_9METZ|nr:Zinc finger HIT domain-containing protein 2-like [Oopsacas minuta]
MSGFEFKLHDDEPTLAHTGALKCALCNNNLARYTCPKCGVSYCGIQCYRSRIHSECSEKFYQQNVREEISSRKVTQEQEEAILQLLTNELSDIFDGEENMDLETRLEGLDLDKDTEEIWSRLTQDEKEEFDKTMGRYVPGYKAWWKEFDLVLDESVSDKPFPKLYPQIPGIGDIFTGKLSETLKYDVINVLYTYVCIHRMYNGEFSSMHEHVTEDILGISLVLRGEGSFSGLAEALNHPAMTLLQMKELEWPYDFVFGFFTDVIEIISRKNLKTSISYVLYCLSDLWDVFGKSLKVRKKSENLKQMKKTLILAQKKLYFYLCWARDQDILLIELCELIQIELQAKQLEYKAFNESKRKIKSKLNRDKRKSKHQLVQEII